MEQVIENPHRRVVEDLKLRNANHKDIIAQEYFGNKFTYDETFKMFEEYRKGFLSLDGKDSDTIIISAPSIVSSVNAFYGAIDADKKAAPLGPGFLTAFTDKYVKEMNSKTVVIFDGFISEDLIKNLHKAGVKNVIITSITDYMNPVVKFIGKQTGQVAKKDFLDEYLKSGKYLPQDMQFIRLKEFAQESKKLPDVPAFPYEEGKIAAYFLTGATTSVVPKCVKAYADGFTKMAQMYDKAWFHFNKGARNAVFIPIFYATGAIHGIHAGFLSGATNIYLPKYDRFAFGSDLIKSKATIAVVAPSHVATLEEAGLKEKSLKNIDYIFIGGEAVTPEALGKYRQAVKKLGVKYIGQGYGMTETPSLTAISNEDSVGEDARVYPMPGVEYKIIDETTGQEVPDGTRGILICSSPCVSAGYTDPLKNKNLFTNDGWVYTGDIAVHYPEGGYRIFGRSTDYFCHNNQKYYMFDIEEAVLKHPGILEAEVIKFSINENEEYPAIVVVAKQEWQDPDKLMEILKYIDKLNVPGIALSIGTRFITHFKTHPITSKRDYLSLPNEKNGYYSHPIFNNNSSYCRMINLDEFNNLCYYDNVNPSNIKIFEPSEELKLIRNKNK